MKIVSFCIYKEMFYKLWKQCMDNGYSSFEARQYAQLELISQNIKFRR